MIRFITRNWNRFEQMLDRIQPKPARRLVISVVGFTILLLGVLMTVLPGPAFIVIPAGLAILALEFAWAKWLLGHGMHFASKVTGGRVGRPAEPRAERPSEAMERAR